MFGERGLPSDEISGVVKMCSEKSFLQHTECPFYRWGLFESFYFIIVVEYMYTATFPFYVFPIIGRSHITPKFLYQSNFDFPASRTCFSMLSYFQSFLISTEKSEIIHCFYRPKALGFEPGTFRFHSEHTNHYTTDADTFNGLLLSS